MINHGGKREKHPQMTMQNDAANDGIPRTIHDCIGPLAFMRNEPIHRTFDLNNFIVNGVNEMPLNYTIKQIQ